jgi:2-amino-4-hydroxy-6-hydroxymethyldihydropteridine diphosphokinase
VLGVSKIYETQPVGEVVQDDFYNIALALEVPDTLKPEVLLTQTQQIEKDMKRSRPFIGDQERLTLIFYFSVM